MIDLHFHLESGKFLSRVWNKTSWQGCVNEIPELENIILQTFHNTEPCLGVTEKDVLARRRAEAEGMVAELPFRRIISKYCEMAIKKEAEDEDEEVVKEFAIKSYEQNGFSPFFFNYLRLIPLMWSNPAPLVNY